MKKKMLRVGINGLGRIGRAIYRVNNKNDSFNIVAVNDINPDINNIAYQLNYDTLYGTLDDKLTSEENYLVNSKDRIRVYNNNCIAEVPWEDAKVDIVIDASGVLDNVINAKKAKERHKLKMVLITHSPDEADFKMVLGANENEYNPEIHSVVSASICDATAIAPVLKAIHENFIIENGYITTLHPWLNYQNLMDGPASSWSVPGQIYHHYALGRSAQGNMIPKPTSAVKATCDVLSNITEEMIGSFSYRTPTAIVGSADISLNIANEVTRDKIIDLFTGLESEQVFKIFHNNIEPLVSSDFKMSPYSAIIDHRWTDVVNKHLLKIVLWYDNEWGYSSRVVDQVKYVQSKWQEVR